jgi:hypothetical protein
MGKERTSSTLPRKLRRIPLRKLTPIDTVVLAELLARDALLVDVEQYALIVRTHLDTVGAVGDEVVQRREHLCIRY